MKENQAESEPKFPWEPRREVPRPAPELDYLVLAGKIFLWMMAFALFWMLLVAIGVSNIGD
jgi:hypothetical protein